MHLNAFLSYLNQTLSGFGQTRFLKYLGIYIHYTENSDSGTLTIRSILSNKAITNTSVIMILLRQYSERVNGLLFH